MTLQSQVEGNPQYIKVLDHGFVGLIDHMGSDSAVVQAARVSYGDGTKTVMEDRALLRYLMRHKHTSPFEMNVVKLHLKLPIFIMRQLVRHRTASLNEYSGRYSIMTDEFYVPELDQLKPQSSTNKQGRSVDQLDPTDANAVQMHIAAHGDGSYDLYRSLLGAFDENSNPDGVSAEELEDFGLTQSYPGIARELARTVLPVNNYTELYWQQNLHNLFHMLRLRLDPHAQYEIRVLAQAVYDVVQPLFPQCVEAFEDYSRCALTMSGMEVELLSTLMNVSNSNIVSMQGAYEVLRKSYEDDTGVAQAYRLSKRELTEFKSQWSLT
jgi:thymidylate synthase (FAD)